MEGYVTEYEPELETVPPVFAANLTVAVTPTKLAVAVIVLPDVRGRMEIVADVVEPDVIS